VTRTSKKVAQFLVQLAEYEAELGRNFDASNAFPPESQSFGFVFSRSKILRQIERDRCLSAQCPGCAVR
jgi:hypothetical protein